MSDPEATPHGPDGTVDRRGFVEDATRAFAQSAALALNLRRLVGTAVREAVGDQVDGEALPDQDVRVSAGSDPRAPSRAVGAWVQPYRAQPSGIELLDQGQLPAMVAWRPPDVVELARAIADPHVRGTLLALRAAAYGVASKAGQEIERPTVTPIPGGVRASVDRAALMFGHASGHHRFDDLVHAPMAVASDGVGNQGEATALLHGCAEALGASLDAAAEAARARLKDVLRARFDNTADVLLHVPYGAGSGVSPGPVIGALIDLVAEGVKVRAWVPEGRPSLSGARLTALELDWAGIGCTMLPDGAVDWVMTNRPIAAALVAPNRVARNGDARAIAGSGIVAAAAVARSVPLVGIATGPARDPGSETGRAWGQELGASRNDAAPRGAPSTFVNPVFDVIPGSAFELLIAPDE